MAASDHVDHLVVQVKGAEENTLLLIDRNEQGVTLHLSAGLLEEHSVAWVNITYPEIWSFKDRKEVCDLPRIMSISGGKMVFAS